MLKSLPAIYLLSPAPIKAREASDLKAIEHRRPLSENSHSFRNECKNRWLAAGRFQYAASRPRDESSDRNGSGSYNGLPRTPPVHLRTNSGQSKIAQALR